MIPLLTTEAEGPTATGPSEMRVGAPIASPILALLAVFAGGAGALATVLPTSVLLRSILLTVFVFIGAGSAILCWFELPVGVSIAGVMGLSLASVVAAATSMVWLGFWHPVPSCLALSLIVASSGLVRLWTLMGESRALSTLRENLGAFSTFRMRLGARDHIIGDSSLYLVIALPFLAFGTWLEALPLLRKDPGGEYGLLATPGGVLLITATVLAITGFFIAIAASRLVTGAICVLVVIFIGRVTVAAITDAPNYVWTYKHIGVVDYIVQHGALPSMPFDIYAPWPGFFTSVAWFSSITDLDLISIANWFPPLVNVMAAVMVAALALGLGLTVRAALTAVVAVQVLNWVGQDYFSPQAIAFVLAIAILALLAHSRDVPAAAYVSLPIFAVLVPTHQLTPVWICVVAVALGLFGRMRPRWLSLIYVLLLATYLYSRRSAIDQYGWFSGFNPFANSETAVSNPGSAGRIFTTSVEQGLSISMWLLAAICFVVVWRRMAARWAAGLIAFLSMLLLFAQNYGGEAILRVYLYSLPGCAVLLAGFVMVALKLGSRRRRLAAMVGAWLVVTGFAVAGMQGYFGSWSYVTITRAQLELSRQLLATTPPDALLIAPAPAGLPARASADYVRHASVNPWYDDKPEALEDALQDGRSMPDTIGWLESHAASNGHRRLYVLLPRQVWAYDQYMHYFKPGALQLLVEQLSSRPGWTKVENDADTLVFVYSG